MSKNCLFVMGIVYKSSKMFHFGRIWIGQLKHKRCKLWIIKKRYLRDVSKSVLVGLPRQISYEEYKNSPEKIFQPPLSNKKNMNKCLKIAYL